MDSALEAISVGVGRLAAALPFSVACSISETLARCVGADFDSLKTKIIDGLSHPHYRNVVSDFLDTWDRNAGSVSAQAVALALLTAANGERAYRDDQSIELVWTGPEVAAIPVRRTEQAILQVLDSAARRIILVSYAVYRIPNIQGALVRSAKRGVRIEVLVETPDKLGGENEYSTLRALGTDVASCSTVYYWPKDQRQTDSSGKAGILHVKCVVADGRQLFLSSANLTEYAFTINMELGLLVTGGAIPLQVEEQFNHMISSGAFRSVG
jgi:phosphatidylserine/phosphatidylglycerophosphate/cardiolipin synthase-like enzyme